MGSRKRSSGKPLNFIKVTLCQYLFQANSKFFKTLGFVSYVFIQPGTPSNLSKCQIIMRIEPISF